MRILARASILFLFITSCVTQTLQENPEKETVIGNDILECNIAGVTSTKTSLSSADVPVWDSNDAISVISMGGNNKEFSIVAGEGTARGSFRGALPSGNVLCAIYPFSEDNSYSSGSVNFKKKQTETCPLGNIADGSNVMVSALSAETHSLTFCNVFGILQLQIAGTATVGRITLTSNDEDDILWGDCKLNVNGKEGTDSQTLTISNGDNVASIVFNAPISLNSTAKPFDFVLPAGALSKGFVIDIYDANDDLIYTRATVANQCISRSVMTVMPVIDDVNRPVDADISPAPFSWAAYNNLARTGTGDQTVIDPQSSIYPRRSDRTDRYVGMFYFIWHNSWSAAGRTINDNQSRLGPGNYEYQTGWSINCDSPHHWGRSYFDYYRDDDAWVLRKHAQMLSDAGVDFICFDVTNHKFYIEEVLNLCRIWKEMRDEGNKTPQLTFMIWHSRGNSSESNYDNFNHEFAVTTLYNNIYAAHPEYADLWFKWEGKPLMLAIGEHVTNTTVRNYFTFRRSWYIWNNNWQTDIDAGDPWWGNGEDRWPWGCCYTDDITNTMKAGTHNGVNECASVSPATHPVSNIGRSFEIGHDWQSYKNHVGTIYQKAPAKGIYFKQQFKAAKQLDPKVLFFTGWNEYLVGHSQAPTSLQFPYMCGKVADYIFVDQYNNEFSRDIEPIRGDFGDNYYYYMADFIRQFKGTDDTYVYNKNSYITIDGKFADWLNVESCYADDKGDNKWRGYDKNSGNGWKGFNTNDIYVNKTGRNDLRNSKVANDGVNINFYIDAAGELTGYSEGEYGLNLYISTTPTDANWEGFNYRLVPTSNTKANLYKSTGGWAWDKITSDISIAVNGKSMEVAIPRTLLGITDSNSFTIDFKWVDNVNMSDAEGIQKCARDGDSAPNGRFRYRYYFKK